MAYANDFCQICRKKSKILKDVIDKKLKGIEAAELLKLHPVHISRLKRELIQGGFEALLRKIPPQPPNQRVSDSTVKKILKLRKEIYYDFNILHFMEKLDAVELWTIACRLFTRMKMDLDLEDVYNHRSTINIFDEMERIKSVLSGRKEATFREISSVYGRVIDRIVSFLSVLELYKNEEVEIVQFESFGNIIIRFK